MEDADVDSSLDRRARHWLITWISSVGGTLVAVLLMWIASNQVTLITSQAVLQRDFVAQADALKTYTTEGKFTDKEIKEWMAQMWPRLRNNTENIEILRAVFESFCDCDVDLNEPEKF